ncbi:MAG: hypothetical protein WCO56_21235 [Verrucomicrobiota bacterium]
MKKTHIIMLCSMALLCVCSCKTPPPPNSYEFNAQVLAMPSCHATMVEPCACYAMFKDDFGRTFYLGSPGASEDVENFIHSLKEGEACYLPTAFMEFLDKQEKASPNAAATNAPATKLIQPSTSKL